MNLDRSIIRFFLGSVWPLIIVLLLLSIGLNAFFVLLDRFTAVPSASESVSLLPSVATDASFARGPEAFGTVQRGFAKKTQGSVKDFTPPIRSYVRGSVALPTLPTTMMLYRDQGFEVDRTLVESVFRGLRAPVNVATLGTFTKSITLRSLDFSTNVTLDAERRLLTVSQSSAPSSSAVSSPADDIEVIAIAREYAESLGIDLQTFGDAVVHDAENPQGTQSKVLWYAILDGFPLLDTNLNPLERLSIDVDRSSRRASGLRLNLLYPESIVRSAYPTTAPKVLDLAFASGGLLPVARDLKGTPVNAEFSSFHLAYVLIPSDHEFPLYIVPIVRAEWSMKPTCKGCVSTTFATFVPALDPTKFQWIRSSASVVPSSSSPSSAQSASSSISSVRPR